jgi:antitoxin component of MazEF toxin-antitoxin module
VIKKLKKVGNSNAVIIDKAIMELVGLEENGEVQITVHDGSVVLTPAHPRTVDQARFEAALERVVTERREVLRRLAQ